MCTRYKCQKEKDGPYPKYKVKKEHEGKPFVINLILRINKNRLKVFVSRVPCLLKVVWTMIHVEVLDLAKDADVMNCNAECTHKYTDLTTS